jgi:hypothetical protein
VGSVSLMPKPTSEPLSRTAGEGGARAEGVGR